MEHARETSIRIHILFQPISLFLNTNRASLPLNCVHHIIIYLLCQYVFRILFFLYFVFPLNLAIAPDPVYNKLMLFHIRYMGTNSGKQPMTQKGAYP